MHMMVRDVMTRQVTSVNGGTPVEHVAEVLVNHELSAVPVPVHDDARDQVDMT